MPPKRAAGPEDDKDTKRQDKGESPSPRAPSPLSSPSVSPASSVSSSSSLMSQVRRFGIGELSPDTVGHLEDQGIYVNRERHPNVNERQGSRAYRPGVPVPAAQMRLVPMPQRSNVLSRERQLQLQRAQAEIDAKNEKREERDSQIDWLNPTGQPLDAADMSFRYWGQYTNEVVLVLPPSSLMMTSGLRAPLECYVTVEELQEEIKNLYCPVAVPPPPSEHLPGRPVFVDHDSDDDFGNGSSAYDADVPVAPPEILDLYLRFLRNCGRGLFNESLDFRKWEYRSSMRRKQGQDKMDERDPPPEVLHMTFYDIEVFVRKLPESRNLQGFIDINRSDWLRRQSNPDVFRSYCQYRDDLRLEGQGAGEVVSDMGNSDRDTVGNSSQSVDRESDGSQSVGSESDDMGQPGGKRRKPSTKRKARRRSASSKRKPTSAAKRRRTATTKSKRARRTTRRN